MLARHNKVFSGLARPTSPSAVKTYSLLMLASGIVLLIVVFSWDPPLPNF